MSSTKLVHTSIGKMKNDARRSRYAAINATWKQLRPDLRHSAEELREARLDYAAAVNGIAPIGSLSDMTIPQLDCVIEAMKRDLQQPKLAGMQSTDFSRRLAEKQNRPTEVGTLNTSSEVVHLASEEQVWAIERVLDYLRSEWGWSIEGCYGFLKRNYRRHSTKLLTPRQASGAMTILLSICAKKEIDRREGSKDKRTRADLRAEMPALKKLIGIDRMNRIARSKDEGKRKNQETTPDTEATRDQSATAEAFEGIDG